MGRREPARAPAKKTADATEEKVYVARSPIHENGVFARRPLPKGTHIGTYEGPPAQRNGPFVLWLEQKDGSVVGRRGMNILRYVNHARPPNAAFEGWDLVTLRKIRTDEEIVVDYGEDAP